MGVALAPVADDGDRAVEEGEIAVAEDRGHLRVLSLDGERGLDYVSRLS